MLCCRSFPATSMDKKNWSIKISRRKRFVSQTPQSFVGDPCVSKEILVSKFLMDKRGERDGVS